MHGAIHARHPAAVVAFGAGPVFDQHAVHAGRLQLGVVGQREKRRAAGFEQPRQRVGPRVGRQQAGMAAHQRGAQAHGEGVAVAAHVHGRALVGQRGGEAGHVGQELARADGHAGAPSQGGVEIAVREQRQQVAAGVV
jgi:hypothetical protein